MGKIIRLSKEIAEKIAAGEVVESPASVVKELVENSLDASASNVKVFIEDGGKKMIKVVDDGEGMSQEDAVIAFERHSTSKIKTVDDLFHITTLGFRGEALASIAAVSRVELITRERNVAYGTRVVVEGGKIISIESCTAPPGTSVTVKDLFYNTPARRKFLGSASGETRRITSLLVGLALARPGVGFFLRSGDRSLIQAPPADGLSRIAQLFGHEIAEKMLPLNYRDGNVSVHGYTSGRGIERKSRRDMYVFVNGRLVFNRKLIEAVCVAYTGILPKDRFPMSFVYISLPPSDVDVNVHPTKREVKFRDEINVLRVVRNAIRNALHHAMESHVSAAIAEARFSVKEQKAFFFTDITENGSSRVFPVDMKHIPSVGYKGIEKQDTLTPSHTKRQATLDTVESSKKEIEIANVRILGQAMNLFIICYDDENLYIIDQHAAHEKLLYEKLVAAGDRVPKVMLLDPIIISFSPQDAEALRGHLSELAKYGFEISDIGNNTFAIRSLPFIMGRVASPEALEEVLSDLVEGVPPDVPLYRKKVLQLVACHSAVRAGDKIDRKTMEEIVRGIFSSGTAYACPHGRPSIIKLTRKRLISMFERT